MSLLETRGLTAFYGDFQALYGVDMAVAEGETVAIVGANGAGKSTLMAAITGRRQTPPEMIEFDGKPIGGLRPAEIMARGIGGSSSRRFRSRRTCSSAITGAR